MWSRLRFDVFFNAVQSICFSFRDSFHFVVKLNTTKKINDFWSSPRPLNSRSAHFVDLSKFFLWPTSTFFCVSERFEQGHAFLIIAPPTSERVPTTSEIWQISSITYGSYFPRFRIFEEICIFDHSSAHFADLKKCFLIPTAPPFRVSEHFGQGYSILIVAPPTLQIWRNFFCDLRLPSSAFQNILDRFIHFWS